MVREEFDDDANRQKMSMSRSRCEQKQGREKQAAAGVDVGVDAVKVRSTDPGEGMWQYLNPPRGIEKIKISRALSDRRELGRPGGCLVVCQARAR